MESVAEAARGRKHEEVKSAARVLEVLELLGVQGARLSLAEMASGHVRAQEQPARDPADHGGPQVGRSDPSGTRYGIGLKALLTGTAYLEGDDVTSLAGPVLDVLAEETGEAVHLGRLDGTHVVYLAKRESRHALRMYSAVGRRLPAHATGLGKAVLSQFDPAEVQRRLDWPLERLTPSTVTDPDALLAQLAETRCAAGRWTTARTRWTSAAWRCRWAAGRAGRDQLLGARAGWTTPG